ncbi:hypothetical protein PMAA_051590 [Talaromyces marneffei ATCC 18224]|uniref:Uncharacterized protein n=1 Tax=Talaromyces marneffei (strain ATCC 18224 / CBS 334.59 / QM 7333) TaxID=441960 RepID=B6QN08_TALMQ|nr:hypothetical protein PMAA_051590 [Talaromyces marneffei ATCC 18224]
MENTDQLTSSKILEVLYQISARLEDIDHRLQVSRPPPPAQHHEASRLLASIIQTRSYNLFRTKICLDGEGGESLQEIVFPPGPLLHLIQTLSGFCPHHHTAKNGVTYMFPFTEIMGQWEILRIIREHTSPYARGFLGRVCPEGEHKGLERDVGELLDCIESSTNCGPSTKERCAQLDSGRVSFIHLPHIFARGALISSNSDDDGCQVVEVVSCEINSASASGDVCEVLYWHFRWSRRAVIKYNGRFRVQHFTGTKRLKDLPFSPIATYSNPGETIESYYLSVESGGEALSFLKSLPPPESEPYPRFSYVQNILGQPETTLSNVIIDDPKLIHHPSNMIRIDVSPEMRCTCDLQTKPSEIDSIFSSSRYSFLAPARLDAFDLSSKKWIKVATTSLQPIPDTESTLNDYEVNTVLKSSLDLEVKSYASQRQRYYQQLHDFVGVTMPPGLFYHFHGPRGVGKTLLAEILAESHRLPLMLLRLTDFGLDLSTFGENLKELMHLSSRWGAVLVITEADGLLQARSLYGSMTRDAMVAALIDSLASYNGIIIFFTSEIAQLDRSLKDKLRLVSFSNLSAEQMMHIFKVFLKRAALSELDSGTEIEMISWFEDVITDWTPSGQQILSLVRISFDQAVSQRRQAQLADLVAAYSAKTGSLNFWGFETEAVSYADSSLDDGSERASVLNRLSKDFGDIFFIPDDGRISLTFSKSFLQALPSEHSFQHIKTIKILNRQLLQSGGLRIVDWGWPRKRWSPQIGCMYELKANGPSQSNLDMPKTKWERFGFTFGLQRILNSTDTYVGSGRPWRRLM